MMVMMVMMVIMMIMLTNEHINKDMKYASLGYDTILTMTKPPLSWIGYTCKLTILSESVLNRV